MIGPVLCECGHKEDEHAEYGHERNECGWEGCSCKEFDGVSYP